MHREFAIDPKLLGDPATLRVLIGQLGWQHGRLLCAYPRKQWLKLALDQANLSGREAARFFERLNMLKEQAVVHRQAATYEASDSWRANVERLASELPFAAIVSADAANDPADVLDSLLDSELWRPASGVVPREAKALTRHLALLLRTAREVRLVDPYLRPQEQAARRVLQEIIQLGQETHYRQVPALIEVHTCLGKGERSERDPAHVIQTFEQSIPQLLPDGMTFKVFVWRERPAGQELHNRYLLTDKAGVDLGTGFRESRQARSSDDIGRMPRERHRQRWHEYSEGSTTFELAAKPTVFKGDSLSHTAPARAGTARRR